MAGVPHDPVPAARAVGLILAPVVACLRGDDEGYGVLLEHALEGHAVTEVVRAAPSVARVYLRLAPPPDGADRICAGYEDAAAQRFADDEVVHLGAGCLHVARASERVGTLAELAEAVFVVEALEHGDRTALAGAIASCWWAAASSASLRGVDPIDEAAAICRYVARVA